MFYSRRIGRAISENEAGLAAGSRILDIPKNTTILGAAKLTGKTNDGLSIGVLQAFTQEERVRAVDSLQHESDRVLEPFAYYSVIRLRKDIFSNSNVGMIFTSVAKDSRTPAFTNGYDWSIKLDKNTYSIDGFLALSNRTNSDNERITGSAGKFALSKIAAVHRLWSISGDYTSKKYNINDVGFFFSPNDIGTVWSLTYKEDIPAAVVRNYSLSGSLHYRDNFDGVSLFRDARLSGQLLFDNYWRMTASAETDYGLYDQFETRGNGLYRKPVNRSTSTYIFSDERNAVVIKLGQRFSWDDKIKSSFATEAGIYLRSISWMEWSLEGEHQKIINQEAWMASAGGVTLFGDRVTDQYNMVLRSTLTFTRELTLQLYTQVFLAKGHFANYRQLVTPSEFVPASYAGNPDFNRQSLNMNLVLRWEYSPGSTLYLVWSQARSEGNDDYFTTFGNDFHETFANSPTNVILLKVNYWWNL